MAGTYYPSQQPTYASADALPLPLPLPLPHPLALGPIGNLASPQPGNPSQSHIPPSTLAPHVNPISHLNQIPNPNPIPSPNPNQNGTVHPALYRHQQHQQQQQQQQQHQHQQQQAHHQSQQYQQQQHHHQGLHQPQQFYPNAYPIIPPTSSSPYSIQPQAIGGQAHLAHPHAQQHVPSLNQEYGKGIGGGGGGSGNHGGPTSMPPPSTLPTATGARRAFLQPHGQRPGERWPMAVNDEQRQMREQYIQEQVVPYSPEQQQALQSSNSTASSIPTPRHSMQKQTTPPGTMDARRSLTPTGATTNAAEPSSQPQPQPPKPTVSSPGPPSLESQRVDALLELNRVLLQEAINLQSSGKACVPTQAPSPPQSDTKPDGGSPTAAQKAPPASRFSKEYVEYMRRIQCNLTYLAAIAERHTKPQNVLQFPTMMEPPSGGENEEVKETLQEMYIRLRELWPDYKGK